METNSSVIPEEPAAVGSCTVSSSPNCPILNDAIATMAGEISDTVQMLQDHISNTNEMCTKLLGEYEAQVKENDGALDAAQVKLAEVTGKINAAEQAMSLRDQERALMEKELEDKRDECASSQKAGQQTMCGLKSVRLEIYHMHDERPIFQDCEVTDWIPGECSVSCGEDGGTQMLNRKVVAQADGGAVCPPLAMQQACNEFPCPIDCAMGDWSGWSACSKDCGGGVEVRARHTKQESAHGGDVCESNEDTRQCNGFACTADCVIDDWSEWTPCSQQCGGGIISRRKTEITPPRGEGKCEDENAKTRFERKECNMHQCPDNVMCESMVDVLVVVDGSGSLRASGFAKEREWVTALVDRLSLGDTTGKIGVVQFADEAHVVSPMSFDATEVKEKVAAMQWGGAATNLAAGLSTALNVLTAGGRTDAPSLVIVISDGVPNSHEDVKIVANKVRRGARLVFVPIGEDADLTTLGGWASYPPDQNLVPLSKETLEFKLPFVLATLCSDLFCSEAMTNADGSDYRGCQSVTTSGKRCAAWTDKLPPPALDALGNEVLNDEGHTSSQHRQVIGLGEHNFCRNPDGRAQLYCYTNDPDMPVDNCDPLAHNMNYPF